jgi:hypothetical protein
VSERGYIKFYRSTLKHPFFRDDAERMAWLRLLSDAAWKPYKKRAGEFFVELQRGEVVGAVRYLASEWEWSKGKVERFLIRLKNEGMIETRTETGITVITICKYNEFQGGDDEDGTPMDREPGHAQDAAGTAPGHARDAGGDNKEELKHSTHSKTEEGKTITGDLLGNLAPVVQTPAAKTKAKRTKPILTPGLRADFDRFWAECPVQKAKDRALPYFIEVVTEGRATVDLLVERMIVFRGAEEAKFTSGRYREPWQFTTQPVAWLRDGHYANQVAAIALDGPRLATGPSGRTDSAIAGIASRIREADFDGGNR